MFITDKSKLLEYTTPNRLWQGIPGIAVTKKGRIFITFYSGGTKEEIENFCVLTYSDDGQSFSEPVAAAFDKNHRCYDPCLWTDPKGRLWFIWAYAPDHGVYAVICDDPDADELVWGKEFKIGNDVMMNKPTILSTGEWLFPITVWRAGLGIYPDLTDNDKKAFAYKSVDNGASFTKLGGTAVDQRSFDEHMILELNDGRLAMFVRTGYGIGVSYSFDRGKTWTTGSDSGLGGPCSRFFIRRLKSGRILLINHYNFSGRNNLTAMLSEDECATWKYKLLIDGRSDVSYPDAVEADDGYIYITYDRERGAFLESMDQVYASAREILFAKITEDDIIKGKLTDPGSKLQCVASKLGKYAHEDQNPFGEIKRLKAEDLSKALTEKSKEEILSLLFECYSVNCMNMHKIDHQKLDTLISQFVSSADNSEDTVLKIISLLRSVDQIKTSSIPIVERIKELIEADVTSDLTVETIAKELGMSMYYMCHLFKKSTGITIVDYKNSLKISLSKKLLITTDMKITEIAQKCGFGSDSYFSKLFASYENITPTQYRELLKK